jgi:hypothetical protein
VGNANVNVTNVENHYACALFPRESAVVAKCYAKVALIAVTLTKTPYYVQTAHGIAAGAMKITATYVMKCPLNVLAVMRNIVHDSSIQALDISIVINATSGCANFAVQEWSSAMSVSNGKKKYVIYVHQERCANCVIKLVVTNITAGVTFLLKLGHVMHGKIVAYYSMDNDRCDDRHKSFITPGGGYNSYTQLGVRSNTPFVSKKAMKSFHIIFTHKIVCGDHAVTIKDRKAFG